MGAGRLMKATDETVVEAEEISEDSVYVYCTVVSMHELSA